MWIQIPGAFVSIVVDHDDTSTMVVRARAREHLVRFLAPIETEFGPHFIFEDKKGERDYQFRAYMDREVCAGLVAKHVEEMTYTNFKNASKQVDPEVTGMFEDWWQDHYNFQEARRKK